MALQHVDGGLLKQMVLAATRTLDANKETVNALNVFPVPDGDTGSNMSLTMSSASREVDKAAVDSVGKIAQALAQGSLMGARGNSGVILSQLFRGFARQAGDHPRLDARDLARCLEEGVDTAYKAVMKPVEGTILTVARESAAAAAAAARRGADIGAVLEAAASEAEASLARTPDLLPVLKKAGVVDSGGKGLCYILSGYLEAVRAAEGGTSPAVAAPTAAEPAVVPDRARDVSPVGKVQFKIDEEISFIQFPYDTELFIRGADIPLDDVRTRLEELGDCVYVVGTPELAKVHIHTGNPGPVLSHCIQFGDLINIEIHNMREQHEDLKGRADEAPPPPPTAAAEPGEADHEEQPSAVVAVAVGPGLEAIFKSLGVTHTIQGGQTMNPSTQDILDAVEAAPSRQVFVLPNNKNIILAAEQAAALTDKRVFVIPTRSIPQGIAAVLAWLPEADPDKTARAMERALGAVQTGEVTFAVRDTAFGELQIRAGDILGLWNGQIVATGEDPDATVHQVLSQMVADAGGEVITLYYGEGVDPERAEALAGTLRQRFPDHEVEVQFGGQPLYFYVFSLE